MFRWFCSVVVITPDFDVPLVSEIFRRPRFEPGQDLSHALFFLFFVFVSSWTWVENLVGLMNRLQQQHQAGLANYRSNIRIKTISEAMALIHFQTSVKTCLFTCQPSPQNNCCTSTSENPEQLLPRPLALVLVAQPWTSTLE